MCARSSGDFRGVESVNRALAWPLTVGAIHRQPGDACDETQVESARIQSATSVALEESRATVWPVMVNGLHPEAGDACDETQVACARVHPAISVALEASTKRPNGR
ncbi:hypothetical protein P9239_14840 [Caballeronia sp. LZ062]|uniref:hypothetical protein n=1 Tax=unclassified Caballeronia TaxID=2646786 RepID=UPI0028563FF5|nr:MULTISPECIES: hypothetical protein [unclassified Caballeronia]MDR5853850.1 hypothetical protein [Caballeronia sp. LZ050]MDR5871619.1 hypothetical protein [Caballeronia sp. LZ062]